MLSKNKMQLRSINRDEVPFDRNCPLLGAETGKISNWKLFTSIFSQSLSSSSSSFLVVPLETLGLEKCVVFIRGGLTVLKQMYQNDIDSGAFQLDSAEKRSNWLAELLSKLVCV